MGKPILRTRRQTTTILGILIELITTTGLELAGLELAATTIIRLGLSATTGMGLIATAGLELTITTTGLRIL